MSQPTSTEIAHEADYRQHHESRGENWCPKCDADLCDVCGLCHECKGSCDDDD